jgi:hypothetical protein
MQNMIPDQMANATASLPMAMMLAHEIVECPLTQRMGSAEQTAAQASQPALQA